MLYQSLAERAAADDESAVVVLNGTCKDFAGAGATLVNEHHEGQLLERASSVAAELFARRLASLGIDNQLSAREEFVGHLDGDVHVSAPIAAQVDDELAHTLDAQLGHGNDHLGVGLFAKVLHAQIACGVVNHVCGIDALYGYVASDDVEIDGFGRAVAPYAQAHMGAFLSLEVLHHLGVLHAHEVHRVGGDDTVASQEADFL